MILVVNICTFALTISQETNSLTEDMKTQLGEIILTANTSINTCSSLFSSIYLASGVWIAFKSSKNHGLCGKTTWINVLVSPYQNPGMDFHGESLYLSNGHEASLRDNIRPRPRSIKVTPIKNIDLDTLSLFGSTNKNLSSIRNKDDSVAQNNSSRGDSQEHKRFTNTSRKLNQIELSCINDFENKTLKASIFSKANPEKNLLLFPKTFIKHKLSGRCEGLKFPR